MSDNILEKEDEILEDTQKYNTQIKQYLTEGQDVVMPSEDVGFEVMG